MQEVVKNRELVSALADGQLRGEEFARTVEWVGDAEDARLTWHAYHLVGDVLRSGVALNRANDADLLPALKRRLQAEATPLPIQNATGSIADSIGETVSRGLNDSEDGSANEAHFRWQRLAGVASLALVALAGWQYFGGFGAQPGALQLAQAPVQAIRSEAVLSQPAVDSEPRRMIRDPQLDALLAAHRQFGGTSALQGPSGFLRNATFEGTAP